ncbi:MAG: DUF4836 family protein [Bacteroidaceae bacterium]|nr:DUF4836 family protein [Bacteroidaceae bacterium]
MKKLFVVIALLLIAGVAAAWYFMRDTDNGRDVLPENATSVLVFEPLELFKGLGLEASDFKALPSEVAEIFEAIDLAKPIYAFTTESSQFGVSLSLKDADKFLKTLNSNGFDSEEKEGLRWFGNNQAIACIDNDKLLLMEASSNQDALQTEMSGLMKQNKKSVPILASIKKSGFLRFSTALDKLPKEVLNELPADINLSDARLNAALSLGKKDITLAAALQTPKPLMEEELLQPIKGNLSGIGPADPIFSLSTNLNGEKLLELLRKQPQLRTALLGLNLVIDADMILKAIDGDVSIVVPTLDTRKPEVLLTATLANTDFLKNADNWKDVRKMDASNFVASYEGIDTYFGVKNGLLYLSSSQRLVDNACEKTDVSLPNAKGKRMLVSVNAGQIIKNYPAIAMMFVAMPQLRESVEAIDGITLSADTQQSFELSLKTNKPVKDIVGNLKTLVTGK